MAELFDMFSSARVAELVYGYSVHASGIAQPGDLSLAVGSSSEVVSVPTSLMLYRYPKKEAQKVACVGRPAQALWDTAIDRQQGSAARQELTISGSHTYQRISELGPKVA
jgi:hypothetical protein